MVHCNAEKVYMKMRSLISIRDNLLHCLCQRLETNVVLLFSFPGKLASLSLLQAPYVVAFTKSTFFCTISG